jgi:hypothetical protein
MAYTVFTMTINSVLEKHTLILPRAGLIYEKRLFGMSVKNWARTTTKLLNNVTSHITSPN